MIQMIKTFYQLLAGVLKYTRPKDITYKNNEIGVITYSCHSLPKSKKS